MPALEHLWAIDETTAKALGDREFTEAEIRSAELEARGARSLSGDELYETVGRVAVIPIAGSLSQRRSFYSYLFGGGRMTLQEIGRAVSEASVDQSIDTIVLAIDSPGGTVAGTAAVVDKVYAARGSKRVIAYAENKCSSAAMWIASQAHEVVVGKTCEGGSVGVIGALRDDSELYKKIGIKWEIFRSGDLKAPGQRGEALGDGARSYIQEMVDNTADIFIGDVARGRGISESEAREKWQVAREWIGEDLVAVGLADRVDTFDNLISSLVQSDVLTDSFAARSSDSETMTRASVAQQTEESHMSKPNEAGGGTTVEVNEESLVDRIKKAFAPALTGEVDSPAAPTEASAPPWAKAFLAKAEQERAAQSELVTQLTSSLEEQRKLTAGLQEKIEAQEKKARTDRMVQRIDRLVERGRITPAQADVERQFFKAHGNLLTDEEFEARVSGLEAAGALIDPSRFRSTMSFESAGGENTIDLDIDQFTVAGTRNVDLEGLDLLGRTIAEVGQDDGTPEYHQRFRAAAYRLERGEKGVIL